MIRFIQQVTVFLALLVTTLLTAQNFQGNVVYQSKIKMDDSFKKRMDTIKMDEGRKQMMLSMMKKMMEKSYVLAFNKTTSIYKEEEKLDQPNEKMRFRMFNAGILFKDVSNKTYTKQKEFFGKIFLIKDSLKKTNWQLEKESKQIGKYLCFKATAMVEKEKQGFSRFRRKKKEAKDSIQNKKPKLIKLTVWYTPEIPVSNGPENYQGLPGLILEMNVGKLQLLATKVTINPKEKIEITEPVKGKIVTQKEYNDITKKKIAEMRSQYKNTRKKGENRRHFR